MEAKNLFVGNLINWYEANARSLPWRKIKDSYCILVSEFMLQQTRVKSVVPYYYRFLSQYPTIQSLSQAKLEEILTMWKGLGYYRRGRMLHQTAIILVEQFEGKVPSDYDDLIALPGVGSYTANALLSFVHNHPKAAVDGNALRVISRYLSISDSINKQSVKQKITTWLDLHIDRERPAVFNQAIMELGATVCVFRRPKCMECPISDSCLAFARHQQSIIPYSIKKKQRPHYDVCIGILYQNGKLLMALRPISKMLGGLWEFPGGKRNEKESLVETLRREWKEELDVHIEVGKLFMSFDHVYTHFKVTLYAYFVLVVSGCLKPLASDELRWVSFDEIEHLPVPRSGEKIISRLKNHLS